ncbi:hypothetical protein GCM10019016_088580 [Streptomyces prasinosporus]|uniref:Methyltransferase domain-containing protein n=1 Tax=Streptomyces prasinosporus TaxID=68256 RepID=A0ABP6U5J7_9ACTN
MPNIAFSSVVHGCVSGGADDPLRTSADGTGTLLRQLVMATGAESVVECGGAHVVPIAEALRSNGRGRVVGCGAGADRVTRASDALERAGLAAYGRMLPAGCGDARPEVPGPVDLLVLAGAPECFLPSLRQWEPRILPGAMVVACGVREVPEGMTDFLAHVRAAGGDYLSLPLALDEGWLELAVRSA